MLVYTDDEGRYLGHLDHVYPAIPEVLEKVRSEQDANVWDIPSFSPEFWYFPNGVPTIRPILQYQEEEFIEDTDRVIRITGIPAGTKVTAGNVERSTEVIADEEPTEFVFREPGEYMIRFEAFPFQAATLYVQVVQQGNVEDGTGGDRPNG